MELNLDFEQSEGTWFPFVKSHVDDEGKVIFHDEEPDGRMKIRSLAPFIEKKLLADENRNQREFVFNPNSKLMEAVVFRKEVPISQSMKETHDMWDETIMDWEGFKNKSTQEEIVVNRENKIAIMKVPMVSRFYDRCQKLLSDQIIEDDKVKEKN